VGSRTFFASALMTDVPQSRAFLFGFLLVLRWKAMGMKGKKSRIDFHMKSDVNVDVLLWIFKFPSMHLVLASKAPCWTTLIATQLIWCVSFQLSSFN